MPRYENCGLSVLEPAGQPVEPGAQFTHTFTPEEEFRLFRARAIRRVTTKTTTKKGSDGDVRAH